MSENTTGFAVNLVEDPTFTATVNCKIPGSAPDTWRDLSFKASYRVMDEDEQEALPINITTREMLRKVLVSVDGIPGAVHKGEELSPVEVVIHNQFTSDAAYAIYKLRTTQNGREITSTEAMKSATTRGNSSRSRGR